jgi:hypothetical protein
MYIPPLDEKQISEAASVFLNRISEDIKNGFRGEVSVEDLKRNLEGDLIKHQIIEEKEQLKEKSEVKEVDLATALRNIANIWKGHQYDKRLTEVLAQTVKDFLPDTQEIEVQGTYEAKTYFEGSTQPSVAEFEAYLDGFQAGAKYIIGGLAR